ncbi:12223_t:CDS:2, partial [Dentiscutata heterogama]
FKESIVYLIQHQFSNYSSSIGSRCITIPCLESQFIGVFGNYIAWYAPTQQTYECQTAVILFTPTQTKDDYNNTKNSGFNTLSQDQNAT